MRNQSLLILSLVAAVLPGPAAAQKHVAQKHVAQKANNVLVEVSISAEGTGLPKGALDLELKPATLHAGLTNKDLDQREAYFGLLVRRLRVQDKVASGAWDWLRSKSKGVGEAAWTARLVLRELRQSERASAQSSMKVGNGWQGIAGVISTEGQTDEVLSLPDQGLKGLELWLDQTRDGAQSLSIADVAKFDGCTFELRCGPGSVRLRIAEFPEVQSRPAAPGSNEQRWTARVREYVGASLPEILGRYPELGGSLPFKVPGVVAIATTLRTDVLGVYTQELTSERRAALKLPPDVGVEVARVVPGTIAQALGLDRGAVIYKVCNQLVNGTGDDISGALNAAHREAVSGGTNLEVEVVWFDAWAQRQKRIWRGDPGAK